MYVFVCIRLFFSSALKVGQDWPPFESFRPPKSFPRPRLWTRRPRSPHYSRPFSPKEQGFRERREKVRSWTGFQDVGPRGEVRGTSVCFLYPFFLNFD